MLDSKDTYYVKIQGKANIEKPLSIGHNYRIVSDCSITQEKKDDMENGSVSITWKAEPITCEITNENGKIIKAKDPRKNSMKIRNYLWKLYYEEGLTEEFNDVYDAATLEILMLMPNILRGAIKRLNK